MEKEIFGALSVAAMVFSRGAYFTSIMKGNTKPHAFSWLIWAVISSIGFAAQVVKGAGAGSWTRGFGAATCFILVVLGWTRGERRITRADWITLIVAFSAIPLWIITQTPVWSVVLVCVIDTSGYLPTVRKAWHKPEQETPVGYMFSSFGAFLSLLAIDNYNPSTWLYPIVLVFSNGLMAVYLKLRLRHLRLRKAVAPAAQTA